MVDEEDRDPVLGRQGPQPLAQLLALVGVEPGRGLVEQHQLGAPGERPADADELALAERDLPGVAGGDVVQAADLDRPVDAGPVHRAPGQEQVAEGGADGHVLAGHQQVLLDREVVEELDRLERPGQAQPRPPVRAQRPDVAAVEDDPPGRLPGVAGERVDHRGLARPVRPDEPEDGAPGDLQVDVGDGDDAPVGHAQPGDVKQRLPAAGSFGSLQLRSRYSLTFIL